MTDSNSATEEAPWQPDQEWANALTHGVAAVASLLLGMVLVVRAAENSPGMAIACVAYMLSALGTFTFSTLSHLVPPGERLDRLRAWDQAMIYCMISGTYTPIIFRFADPATKVWLLSAIWVAAGSGFLAKVILSHRVNSIGTVSYLLLGWLPAIPLNGLVPTLVVTWMFIGGVLYTVGVVFLLNDRRVRYLHAVWHLFVMAAALAHFWTILRHVVPSPV